MQELVIDAAFVLRFPFLIVSTCPDFIDSIDGPFDLLTSRLDVSVNPFKSIVVSPDGDSAICFSTVKSFIKRITSSF